MSWTCDQRGDCCRLPAAITMTREEQTAILAVTDRATTWLPDPDPRFVRLQAQPCPLLEADGRCSVYDSRPYNCRRFLCFRDDGEPWREDATGTCLNAHERIISIRAIRRQYALNQRKTQRWALAHGWSA